MTVYNYVHLNYTIKIAPSSQFCTVILFILLLLNHLYNTLKILWVKGKSTRVGSSWQVLHPSWGHEVWLTQVTTTH